MVPRAGRGSGLCGIGGRVRIVVVVTVITIRWEVDRGVAGIYGNATGGSRSINQRKGGLVGGTRKDLDTR